MISTGRRVLDRYTLLEALPGAEDQQRWRARDEATGEQVEVVGPAARVALRPGAADRFAQAQARPDPCPPALLPAGAQGLDQGRPLATRPAVAGPLPSGQRLDPQAVRAWAAWLGPAVLEAGGALGGMLEPADLVLDLEGRVRLAPAGLVGPEFALRPSPFRAPEGGQAPTGALYGLGVLLFQALTGALPGPPPGTRRARELDPALPEDVDALLAALLDPSPERRRQAVLALPAAEPPPVLAPRQATPTALARSLPPAEVSRGRLDREPAPWLVVLEPQGSTEAMRRRVAALTDRDLAQVEEIAREGLPLVIEEAASRAEAEAAAARRRTQGIPALPVAAGEPGALRLKAWGLLGASLAGGLASMVLLGLAFVFLPWILGPAALALLLCALVTAALGLRARTALQAADRVWAGQRALETRPRPAEDEPLDQARRRLRLLHAAILDADLAAPVRVDLEGAVTELEEELARLASARPAEGNAALAGLLGLVAELEAALAASPGSAPARQGLHEGIGRRIRAVKAARGETPGET